MTISTIVGTPGNDNLVGTSLGESIFGFDGNDVINGLGGADVLFGGDGNDILYGGTGVDTLLGGEGDDILVAQSSDTGHDDYNGGNGNDILAAQSLTSGSSYTVSIGNVTAVEEFQNTSSSQTVNISAKGYTNLESITKITTAGGAIGTITGSTGDDHISGFDQVNGAGWNDVINAGGGNDSVFGNGGNDTLNGGSGNDNIDGGIGNDVLTGGSGSDEFRFNAAQSFGVDTVTDFTDGVDQIEIYNSGSITSFNLYAYGANSTLVEVNGNYILLDGFDPANIDSSDFEFIA